MDPGKWHYWGDGTQVVNRGNHGEEEIKKKKKSGSHVFASHFCFASATHLHPYTSGSVACQEAGSFPPLLPAGVE